MEKLMTLACVKLKKKEREKDGVGKEGREKKEGKEKENSTSDKEEIISI